MPLRHFGRLLELIMVNRYSFCRRFHERVSTEVRHASCQYGWQQCIRSDNWPSTLSDDPPTREGDTPGTITRESSPRPGAISSSVGRERWRGPARATAMGPWWKRCRRWPTRPGAPASSGDSARWNKPCSVWRTARSAAGPAFSRVRPGILTALPRARNEAGREGTRGWSAPLPRRQRRKTASSPV
jgi:hypothetical protein